jgi:hypothetical protein
VVIGIESNNVEELVTFSDFCDVSIVWAKLIEKFMIEKIDKIRTNITYKVKYFFISNF